MSDTSPRRAIFYGLAVSIIWGAQPVVATFGYRAGLNALDLTFLRFAASGLVMLPAFLQRGVKSACGIGWQRAIILAVLAGPLYNLVLIGGLTWAPASHSSLIYPACTPVFTAILTRMFLKSEGRVPIFAVSMLLLGVVVIKLDGLLHPASAVAPGAWRGDMLFVGAALMWSTYTILMRRWKTDPSAVVTVVQVSGLLYVPAYLVTQGTGVFELSLQVLGVQMLYQGLLVSVFSIFLFNETVRQIGTKASLFTAIMPAIGVTLAVIVLGDPLSWTLVLGALLIVGGLTASFRKPS
ncbi:DMT family transporter [Oxalobacteraceae bacterium OM1]|nr:DMT family transporter [Oxalobacteraceae bacterium OM1]